MGALFDSIPGEAEKGKAFAIRSKGNELFLSLKQTKYSVLLVLCCEMISSFQST